MQSFCLYPISYEISEKADFTYEFDRYFTKITIFGVDIFCSFLHTLVLNLESNIEIVQIKHIWKKNRYENWVSTTVLITVLCAVIIQERLIEK